MSITTQAALDSQVCEYDWPSTSSPPPGFTKYSGNLDGVVGVSLTGVPIFAGTSEDNKDPFYPNPNVPPFL